MAHRIEAFEERPLMTYLWVGLGSAVGGVARLASSEAALWLFGATFPWGTLFVNVLGSFLIGLIGAATAPGGSFGWPAEARAFVMLGVLGGFTTFSSFSLQTLALAKDGEWAYVGLNVLGSVALCLLVVWLGWIVGEALAR